MNDLNDVYSRYMTKKVIYDGKANPKILVLSRLKRPTEFGPDESVLEDILVVGVRDFFRDMSREREPTEDLFMLHSQAYAVINFDWRMARGETEDWVPPYVRPSDPIIRTGILKANNSPEGRARVREIGEALGANRGAGNSYDEECRNPDGGGNPGRFSYPVTRADITRPKRSG